MPPSLRVISLFAGIGGFDLAFERAGCTIVVQVESDPQCRDVLARHWPTVPRHDDVRTYRARPGEADIVVGGFPCQDLSVAGKRAGLSGERSGLFFEMVRIAHECRADYVVWENVPGLLSSDNGRDFTRVLMALDAVGYGGAWTLLDAQYFGVPQRRRRVFGVFASGDSGAERCAEILSFARRMSWRPAARGTSGQATSRPPASGAGGDGARFRSCIAPDKASTLVASGRGTARVGESRGQDTLIVDDYGVRRLTPLECERLQGFPDGWTEGCSDTARHRMLGNAVAVPVAQWIAKRLIEVEGRKNA